MHRSSRFRMKWFLEQYVAEDSKEKLRVLDVGSYDVNGTYRDLFDEDRFSYTGADMQAGPNVDIALKQPYHWAELETDSYDIVISGQAFEHMEFFWVAMTEMARVLKKDGMLCIVVPNLFYEHRYPVDCYRFFSDGMVALARYVSMEVVHAHTNCSPNWNDSDWVKEDLTDAMLVARKPYEGPCRLVDLTSYKCEPENLNRLRGRLIPYGTRGTFRQYLRRLRSRLAGRLTVLRPN